MSEWKEGGYREWLAKIEKYVAAHVGSSGFLVADQVRPSRTVRARCFLPRKLSGASSHLVCTVLLLINVLLFIVRSSGTAHVDGLGVGHLVGHRRGV